MNIAFFQTLPLEANLALFALAASVVWLAGSRLSIYTDEISDRKRIGKAIAGLVFLAVATELPEVVTTLTAAIAGNAALALNNMFGGIAMQTAVLAIADVAAVRYALTFYPRKTTPIVEAASLIIMLSLLQAIALTGDWTILFNVGAGSIVLAILYAAVIMLLRRVEVDATWRPIEVPENDTPGTPRWKLALDQVSDTSLYLKFFAACAAILVFGISLVHFAQRIAEQTGVSDSFIGVTLLAATTSLPELSTTIMAVRLRSYTMAVSNIFGSNLIMLALILPADLAYRNGPILSQIDKTAMFALTGGIVVTGIYIVGLAVRAPRTVLGLGWDSLLVLLCYAIMLTALFAVK